ncbi:MAG TPA: hypothetical protein VME24_12070 [Alphaproteobacteria bacterium]|nr:hypothetical protein [Alphaproteobacteria bacterium]
MDTTPDGQTILKTDALGRVQTPKDRREELLDEFERSGLSGKKFAALVGVKYPTLATWASKRWRERGLAPTAGRAKAVRLLEAAGIGTHWYCGCAAEPRLRLR